MQNQCPHCQGYGTVIRVVRRDIGYQGPVPHTASVIVLDAKSAVKFCTQCDGRGTRVTP